MLTVIKKIIFYFFVFFFVSLCIFIVHLARGGHDAAILMYHSVGESNAQRHSLDISYAAFEKQMDFLHRHHYRVIALTDLARWIKEHRRIPPKTVVLTFDDGYENNYTHVFPLLKKYHFPATVFVAVDFLGQEREMAHRTFKFLTRSMMMEMADSGLVTFGSHTMRHPFLPDVARAEDLWREIKGSKDALEKILKRPVFSFCYPSGGYTLLSENMVQKAGYQAAVTTLSYDMTSARDDVFALRRIKPTEKSANPFVFFVQTSGYYLRLKEMKH